MFKSHTLKSGLIHGRGARSEGSGEGQRVRHWSVIVGRFLLAGVLVSGAAAPAALRITEFVAENDGELTDQDGDTPDWIEVCNDSFSPVNLAGWHLTDNATNLTQWTFPATNLAPGACVVVFASGKDRAVSGAELHANFRLDNAGQFLALVEPDGVTLAHAYVPEYPPQHANVSFGLGREVLATPLVSEGASARYLIPAHGGLGMAWTGPEYNDAGWAAGPTGFGFEAASAGGATNATGAVVLRLDFNDDDSGEVGAANTETGFSTMTLNANPTTVNGITVALSALGGATLDDRDRTTPVASPPNLTQDQLYDDFIFANGQTNGNGLRIRLTGLAPDQDYHVTVWSFDSGSGGGRVSDWIETASGSTTPIQLGYTFDGSVPPVRDGDDTLSGYVRSSSSGVLQIEARRSGGTSHGVFLNALQLVQVGFQSLIATDLGTAMSNRNASAYFRIPFTVVNPGSIQTVKLRMKYDDGFVAYLNGQRIASANAPASPQWNSTATMLHPNSQALAYEEFPLAVAPGLLVSGTNWLAVHGLNISATDGDFLMLPQLESVAVSEFPNRYFKPPTPGAPNSVGYIGLVSDTKFSVDRGFYETPFTVAITSATAAAAIYWTADGSPPSPTNGTLYAGPIPVTGTAFLRAAAFLAEHIPSDIDTHTYIFLRDVLQQPNSLPGYPTHWQANYVADYEMDPNIVNHPAYGPTLSNDLRSIPTLSIVAEHDALWGPANGIYNHAVNSGPDWERAASAELIVPDGTNHRTAFAVNCALRMQGNASRDNNRTPKHSFRLLFKNEFGPTKLRHRWFPDTPAEAFDNIVLRACFTDAWTTRYSPTSPLGVRYRPEDSLYLRDVWMKDSQLDMGWHSAHNNFVHLYVNGLYWGLYNPCERLDASHFASYFGGREGDWDVIRDFVEVLDGDLTEWNRLIGLVNAGITSESAYQAVRDLVDVENLIDYMLLHFHGEAEDWPHHNWYAARRRATNDFPGGKWIFAVWDQEIVCDQLYARNLVNVNNANTPANLYAQLRAWPEFRRLFGDRVQQHLFNGGALTPSNCVARFQERVAQIHRAMVGESARWGDAREFATVGSPATGETFTRDEWWIPELEKLYTNWFPNQQAVTIERLRAAGLYPRLDAPGFNRFGGSVPSGFDLVMTNPNAAGSIFFTLDGTDPREYGTGEVGSGAQSYTAPIALNSTTRVRARVLEGGQWSALVEATFYPPQDLSKLTLTEIMYNPPGAGLISGAEFEFIELKNAGTTTLNLAGLTFTSGITFTFTNGTVLAPGAFFVIVRNATNFAAKYPSVSSDGIYSGRLDNAGETLTLSHPLGSTVCSVTYDNAAPWPVAPDGFGFSLVPKEPAVTQAPDAGARWRASALEGGSPGADDPSPVTVPVVINEVLSASTPPQLDMIELFNPADASANVGGWFLTDDPAVPMKFRIPDGTVIAAGGFVLFDETDFNPAPGSNPSFALSSDGDDIYLFSGDANTNLTGYSHGFAFGGAADGVSFGHHVNSVGGEDFPAQLVNTFGSANAGPRVGPVVIHEIQYHPALGGDEFIELRNISGATVPLFDPVRPMNTWKLSGANYDLPTGIALAPDGLLLVVAIDPAVFRTKHGVPGTVAIVGPYPGVLQDSGERLRLERPGMPDTNGVSYIVVDEVRYNDKAPWPPAADGTGASLQRIAASAYGNEPVNWRAAAPTPGADNLVQDTDGDGLPDDWENAHGTNPRVSDALTDPDHDGQTNRDEYRAGTLPLDAESVFRLEALPFKGNDASAILRFVAFSNRTYTVQFRDALQSGSWLRLADIPAAPVQRAITITNALPGAETRYYRLVTPAQP